MKISTRLAAMALTMVLTIALAGCASLERLFENENKLLLSEIPPAVRAAAEKAVPGLIISGAEAETRDGAIVYEVTGTADGKRREVKVRANGEVLRVETEGDKDRS